MKLPSFGFIIQAYQKVWARFPLAMAAAWIATVFCLILIQRDYSDHSMEIPYAMICALIGVPLFTAIHLWNEMHHWQKSWKGIVLYVLASLLIIGHYQAGVSHFYVIEDRFWMMSLITILLCHLMVCLIPYIQEGSEFDFWEYNKQLFFRWLEGAFYSAVIIIGLNLGILAIDQLFDMDFSEKIYFRIVICTAALFHTVYFYYHFPEDAQFDQKEFKYNTLLLTLGKYILTPIVIIYFLILYAYGTKVLVTWNLPKGWISSLVIGFSIAGILVYLLTYYIHRFHESILVKTFQKYFWWVIILPTILLFVAIARRIREYGITEERYLVFITGIWLTLVSVFFILRKLRITSNQVLDSTSTYRKVVQDLRFIPFSLFCFMLFAYFSPWNLFKVSEQSQTQRLEKSLHGIGWTSFPKMDKNIGSISDSTYQHITSILYYLNNHHGFQLARKQWPTVFESAYQKKPKETYTGDSLYTAFIQYTKLDSIPRITNYPLNPSYNFHSDHYAYTTLEPGFTNIQIINYNSYNQNPILDNYSGITVDTTHTINLYQSGKIIDSYHFKPALESLMQYAKVNNNTYIELGDAQSRIKLIGMHSEIVLYLQSIYLNVEKQKIKIENMNGTVLIKIKN